MIRLIFTCSMLLSAVVGFSQRKNLDSINTSRNNINRKGLSVIAGWAAANIVYSGIAGSQTSGTTRYFHKMNTIWNGVNLGIAAVGLLHKNADATSLSQSLTQQSRIEKLFLFNTGLDVAYVVGGAYLKERANNKPDKRHKLKGYGESIMLQGSALLIFDGVMFLLHQQNGKRFSRLLSAIHPSGNGLGVAMTIE